MTGKAEEKTIPFLRRLVEMLHDDEEAISFVPGDHTAAKNSAKSVGRIIIHDRVKVESDILPKYFNHASFASLRRQLNYFHFVRVGKGRQRGATYRNDAVVVMDDILKLKRRSVGEQEAAAAAAASAATNAETTPVDSPRKSGRSRSIKDDDHSTSRPTVVSPSLSLESSDNDDDHQDMVEDASIATKTSNASSSSAAKKASAKRNKYKVPTLVLDLTKTPEGQPIQEEDYSYPSYGSHHPYSYPAPASNHGFYYNPTATPRPTTMFQPVTPPSDEEVLEGCSALLALNSQPSPSKAPVPGNNTRQVTA